MVPRFFTISHYPLLLFLSKLSRTYQNTFFFVLECTLEFFIVNMYVCILHWLPDGLQVFWKVLSYTNYTLSVPPYQPLSTGSASILGAGATRASPGISIVQTAIVVHTPFIWSYINVLLYRWDFSLENRTRDMLRVFWSRHQGAGPFSQDTCFFFFFSFSSIHFNF